MDIFFRALLNYLGSTEIMTNICNSSSSSDLKRLCRFFKSMVFLHKPVEISFWKINREKAGKTIRFCFHKSQNQFVLKSKDSYM